MPASATLSAEDRARRIRLLLFDVDGVLTDGGIWLFPAPEAALSTAEHAESLADKGGFAFASGTMIEAKGFNAHDGSGVSLARLAGIRVGIVTKRVSEAVSLRARDMRVDHVYMGQAHKMQAVEEMMEKDGVTLEEIAYVGDDIIDLPVMRVCGLAIAVASARPQVKAAAHWVAPSPGGHGAGRDAVEFILEAKGVLDETIERYIEERSPGAGHFQP